jgi:nitroreductase
MSTPSRPDGLPPFDAATITSLIEHRRSTKPKDFSGEPISDDLVKQLLANAHWAPTHGQTEPWHFIVFGGDGLRSFGEAHAELYRAHTSPEEFKQKKYDKMRDTPLLCSHLIVICLRRGELEKIPEIEEVEAVAAAVQNLHLTATALGLGGYWSSGGMTYHPALRDWLGLGAADRVLGFFMLGHLKGPWPQGRRKTDWTDHVEWRAQ